MRPRYEGPTLAERLNNALGELHALKLEHEKEKEYLLEQIQQLKEENERLRTKNKEIKRQHRQGINEGDRPQLNQQNEQTLIKLKSYLQRIQESCRQMTQVAAECKIVDQDIEKAASQIEKNVNKSRNGLEKYLNELVRRWGTAEGLRIENQRLQMQNRQLFELTTNLQQNFRETDKLVKQMGQNRPEEDLSAKLKQLQSENTRLRTSMNALSGSRNPKRNEIVVELQQKISKLTEKLKNSQQQNTTIKNIHQRTMKKLQKLQEERDGAKPVEGEGLQEERKQWLDKNEKMYDQIRKLTRDLMLSEENQKKVREELNNCLQIYGQWEQEREERKIQIEELKLGIETYLQKIEELESNLTQKENEIDSLQEQFQVSESQKQKIVSVYQLQVQELNDGLFKKQDAIAELQTIVNRQHYKHEELKKQFAEIARRQDSLQEQIKQNEQDKLTLNQAILEKEEIVSELDLAFKLKEEELSKERREREIERAKGLDEIKKLNEQKQEIVEVLQEYKDQYYSVKKELSKALQQIQSGRSQEIALIEQLKSILGSSPSKQNDIWQVIASVREKHRAVTDEVKILREAQLRLLHECQIKDKQHSEDILHLKSQCERLHEEIESTINNQQAELKIWKMRIVERQICDQIIVGGVKSLSELLSAVSERGQGQKKASSPSPSKDNFQQMLDLKQKLAKKVAEDQDKARTIADLRKDISDLYQQSQLQKKLREDIETQMLALKESKQQILQQMTLFKEKIQQRDAQIQRRDVQIKQRDVQIQQRDATIQQRGATIQQSDVQIQRRDVQIKQKQAVSSRLQEQLNTYKNIADNLQAELQQKSKDGNILEKEKENNVVLSLELLDLKEQVTKINKQNQDYMTQINHLLQETETANSENTHLLLQLQQLKQQVLLLNVMNQTLRTKCGQITQTLNERQLQIEEYRANAAAFEREKETILAMKREIMERERSDSEIQTAAQEQMMSNGYEIINLNLELQDKNNAIQELQAGITSLRAQIEEQQSETDQLIKQNVTLKATVNQLTAEMAEKTQFLCQKQEELELRCQQLKQKQLKLKELQDELDKKADAVTSIIKKSDLLEVSLENKAPKPMEQREEGELPDYYNILIPDKEEEQELGLESTRQSHAFPKHPEKAQIKEELQFAKILIEEKQQIIRSKQEEINNASERVKALENDKKDTLLQLQSLKEERDDLMDALQQNKAQYKKEIEQVKYNMQNLIFQIQDKDSLMQQLNDRVQNQAEADFDQRDKLSELLQSKEKRIEYLTEVINSHEKEAERFQEQLKIIKRELSSKQVLILDMRAENADLVGQLQKLSGESELLCKEVAETAREKQMYADRLSEIEQMMQYFKNEEEETNKIKLDMVFAMKEKIRLQERVRQMTNQTDALRQKLNGYSAIEQDPQIIIQNMLKLKRLQEMQVRQQTFSKSKQNELKEVRQRLLQSQKRNEDVRSSLAARQTDRKSLLDEIAALKQTLSLKTEREVENSELIDKLLTVQSQCQELKEELSDKNAKIQTLKTKLIELQQNKDSFEESLKQKNRQLQIQSKQNEHYKSQIKRINQEKVRAESQAAKHRFNLEEQQSAIKLKESQISDVAKSSRQTDQIVKELKMEIEALKESNQQLKKQYDMGVRKNVPKPNEDYMSDLPLQTVSRRVSRAGRSSFEQSNIDSNSNQLEMTQKYKKILEQQNKVLKSEIVKSQKASSRLRQAQRSNSSLNGQLSMLKGELKTKSMNIDALERQFKAKTEDYSKLQRKVESLSDQLHLQRKRVKNFEELYQNIQSKRLKLTSSKQEE